MTSDLEKVLEISEYYESTNNSFHPIKSPQDLDLRLEKEGLVTCAFLSSKHSNFESIAAHLTKYAKRYLNVTFVWIDVEEIAVQQIIDKHSISIFPTYLLYFDGQKLDCEISNEVQLHEKLNLYAQLGYEGLFYNPDKLPRRKSFVSPAEILDNNSTVQSRKSSVSSNKSYKIVDYPISPDPQTFESTKPLMSTNIERRRTSATPSITYSKTNSTTKGHDRRRSTVDSVTSSNSCHSDCKVKKTASSSSSFKQEFNTIEILDDSDKPLVVANTPTSQQSMQALDLLVESIIRQSENLVLGEDGLSLVESADLKTETIPLAPSSVTQQIPSFFLEPIYYPQKANSIEELINEARRLNQQPDNVPEIEKQKLDHRVDVKKSRSRSNSYTKSPIEPAFETINETEVLTSETPETKPNIRRKSRASSFSEKHNYQVSENIKEPLAEEFVSLPSKKEAADIPPLDGKVALITGASAGLGLASAKMFASKGAKVYLQGRNRTKLEETIASIKKEFPRAELLPLIADLTILKDVESLGKQIRSDIPKLDILLLNAGIAITAFRLSSDGIENVFQVNYLSQFYLYLLIKGLVESSKTRVVLVSAKPAVDACLKVPFKWSVAEINDESKYVPFTDYGLSKRAIILFTLALKNRGVFASVICPGPVNTEIAGKIDARGVFAWLAKTVSPLVGTTADLGALTQVYACVSDKVTPGSGWEKRGKSWDLSFVNQDDIEKLWTFSESILKDKGLKKSSNELSMNNGVANIHSRTSSAGSELVILLDAADLAQLYNRIESVMND
ncbi:hypothetical protein HDV06_006598 [Boothiomyces sp. JEL0866]|nr:hypothetical protein HDV06_006598 [Boothiomyces sp. JEL0866]